MPGPKSDKLWSEAVRMAAMREMEDPNTPGKKRKRLNIIADNLLRAAVAGDMAAIKELGDRIDGKPTQGVTGPGGEPLPITTVVWQVADVAGSDS